MTQATRNGLIGLLDSPAVAEIDQAVMDAYLSAYSSRADYETNARNQTCFLAVLATAEYHEHWERIIGASTVTETPNDLYPVSLSPEEQAMFRLMKTPPCGKWGCCDPSHSHPPHNTDEVDAILGRFERVAE